MCMTFRLTPIYTDLVFEVLSVSPLTSPETSSSNTRAGGSSSRSQRDSASRGSSSSVALEQQQQQQQQSEELGSGSVFVHWAATGTNLGEPIQFLSFRIS